MAAILSNILIGYNDVIYEKSGINVQASAMMVINLIISDPRVKDLWLMNSPFPIFLIIIAYHYFVSHIGPRIMKNRKPMDVYYPMLVYNFLQIGLNFLFVYKVFEFKWLHDGFVLTCDPVDYSNHPRALSSLWYTRLYFIDKILDLLDTVFMVLRKKHRQVSFLHRYHHIGMVIGGWIGAKYVAGGHSIFFGTINSMVHAIMYSHYQLMLIKPEYGRNLWWKKYITQLQMVQFLLVVVYYSISLLNSDCAYPKIVGAVFIPQNIFMFLLFLDFYRKSYDDRMTPKSSLTPEKTS